MAEAMTVETIIEADLNMRGYWTRLRFPLRTAKGGWSDIDVLGYKPEAKELVIAESKVQGPKRHVYAYTRHTRDKYGDILSFDNENYFSFLKHIGTACKDGVIFRRFRPMVDTLTVQLVSNYYISNDVLLDAENDVRSKVSRKVPRGVWIGVRLETTLDLISRIIKAENASVQGRRYGHPVIDIARELNRYLHPAIRYGGRDRHDVEEIKAALSKKIFNSLLAE